MTDEINDNALVKEEDGDKVDRAEAKNETETKEVTNQPKQRSVSFNRDVHVKRFGKIHGQLANTDEVIVTIV